jgi:hypothetical protein
MNAKSIVVLGLKFIALCMVMFIAFIIGGAVPGQPATTEEMSVPMLPLFIMNILNTTVLTYAIIRSQWHGSRLIATVFVTLFGIQTIMSQIETLVFIPTSDVGYIFIMGLITALIFSPLAVIILSKMKKETKIDKKNMRLIMPKREWAWKLCVIAAVYIILYFTFGYFITWQSPAVREFYGGELIGFVPHLIAVVESNPWLVPFQMLRGLLFALFALPVIRMMKGKWWEAAVTVGILFAVLLTSGLLIPNPYMPEAVRMAHLAETAPSTLIFGLIVVWLLNRHHSSFRDLFQRLKEDT